MYERTKFDLIYFQIYLACKGDSFGCVYCVAAKWICKSFILFLHVLTSHKALFRIYFILFYRYNNTIEHHFRFHLLMLLSNKICFKCFTNFSSFPLFKYNSNILNINRFALENKVSRISLWKLFEQMEGNY